MKRFTWKQWLLLIVAVPVVQQLASYVGRQAAQLVNERELSSSTPPAGQEIRTAVPGGSAFARLDFEGEVIIKVPRHWTYLDDNLRKHLNTAAEATTRLAGLPQAIGDNVVLVAGSAQTSAGGTSATLRLSVRRGPGLTQAQMLEVARMPRVELTQLLTPVLEETRRVMIGVDGVIAAKSSDSGVVTNPGLLCMFFEFQTDVSDGARLSKTYLCPLGDRAVKLSTSYRVSEAMRPVVEYVWQSLRIQKTG